MNRKKLCMISGLLFIIIVLLFIAVTIRPVKAEDGISHKKYVTYIKIKEGDTLWSIANDFYTIDYQNISELVDEIKDSNHIDDTIYIGQYIIVPHYKKIT